MAGSRRQEPDARGIAAHRGPRPIPRWTGFAGKTLWDWLQLLVIPLALASVAFGLNYFANERDQRRADQRAVQERLLAADQKREDALRAYLQQMSTLVLERDLPHSSRGSQVQAVARAFTLTVLRRLDPKRKALVVQFLAQANLIGSEPFDQIDWLGPHGPVRMAPSFPPPKVDLAGADLRNVPLQRADLVAKSFSRADLRGADFRGADLEFSDFHDADLRNADFSGALIGEENLRPKIDKLRPADFDFACVSGARFRGASMAGVGFTAIGWDVDLTGAFLFHVLFGPGLGNVKLAKANTADAQTPANWSRTGMPGFTKKEANHFCQSAGS